MTVTEKIIENGMSNHGGWNKEQLAILGVKWPPKKGWKQRLIGTEITELQYVNFIYRRGRKSNGQFRKNYQSEAALAALMYRS